MLQKLLSTTLDKIDEVVKTDAKDLKDAQKQYRLYSPFLFKNIFNKVKDLDSIYQKDPESFLYFVKVVTQVRSFSEKSSPGSFIRQDSPALKTLLRALTQLENKSTNDIKNNAYYEGIKYVVNSCLSKNDGNSLIMSALLNWYCFDYIKGYQSPEVKDLKNFKMAIERLRNWGADVTLANSKYGENVLHQAASDPNNNQVLLSFISETFEEEILTKLINCQNKKGETPIFKVITTQACKKILTLPGIDLSLTNTAGETALEYFKRIESNKFIPCKEIRELILKKSSN